MTRVTSTSPDVRDRRLRRARAASVVALVAFVAVGIASAVLVADARGSLWLVLADALCAFIAVRTIVRLVAIDRALREGADD
jgi:hypothetical protein